MRLLALLTVLMLAGCSSPDTLFTKLDPDDVGVTFANTITPADSVNAFTFTNFYNGGGVGVGDFNHDGKPDLFFTGNQVSSRLYINETDTASHQIRFSDQTDAAGLLTNRWCSGVSVVDINQDGWDDLYVSVAAHQAMRQTRNLLFVNQRTARPTFREEAARYGLDDPGFTTQAVFFDYDHDDDLDCFLLKTAPDLGNPNYLRPAINDGSHPSTSRLLRNEGPTNQPVFRDVSAQAGVRFEGLGLGVVASDLNGDGHTDLYCSNDFSSSDVLYLNNGDGTFHNTTAVSMAHTSLYGMGVDIADLNNDGKPEVMQLDMLPQENARLKQMLAGQDYDRKEQSLRPQYGYQLQYMRNTLQLNTGNVPAANVPGAAVPRFSELGLLAGVAQTDWSWSTLLADLDLDGRRDVFITNGYRKNVTDRDFIAFTEEFSQFGTDEARYKKRTELIDKVPEVKLNNYVFRNHADLQFEDVSAAWGLNESSYANGAAYADLDADGDLDLIVNDIDQAASIFRNNTREQQLGTYLHVTLTGSQTNRQGFGATVTAWAGGERLSAENLPVRGYLSSMQPGVWFGGGKRTHFDSVQVRWFDGSVETRRNVPVNQTIAFGWRSDQPAAKPTIETEHSLFVSLTDSLPYRHEESDFVDFKTTPALHKMYSRGHVPLATGDLNGDGLTDIIVGPSYRGSTGAVLMGQPGGTFRRREWLPNMPMEAGDVLLFDADRDRDLDVLLVGGGNERPLTVAEAYQPRLFLNDGTGTFTDAKPGTLPTLAVSSQCARAFDYDRDGDADLLLTGRQVPYKYPLPASSYLLRNDGGRFTDVTPQVAPALTNIGMLCDALPLDIDNDRDTDVLLVGEWMPPTILQNTNGRFSPVSLGDSLSGWWNCVAAHDFDGDGDPDLLLGNEGLNTLYRASVSEPVRIVGKDFNQDGLTDPIMGYFIDKIGYPALPRESLNQQLIQFRRKYQRYADYAQATFDDLFTSEERAGAYEGQATQLQSCYAENMGGGRFRVRPLPLLAQQAPVQHILIHDFDHDTHPDALLTGNFYPNEVNMGRQDASQGLLLRGDGKGNFVAIGPDKSGLRLRGDTRRTYLLPKTNRLLTTVNNGPLQVHQVR